MARRARFAALPILSVASLLAGPACNRIEAEHAPPPGGAAPPAAGGFEPRVVAMRRAEIERVTGTDEHGYPLATADRLELVTALRARQLTALEEALAFYRSAYEADFRREVWLDDALAAFGSADPTLEPHLDAWVEALPDSWAAPLARALHHLARAQQAVGPAQHGEGSAAQIEHMKDHLARAWTDAQTACVRAPDLAFAWLAAGRVANDAGAAESSLSAYAQALDLAPRSYLVRRALMEILEPRHGGTHAAMESFARQSRDFLAENPKLVLLESAVLGERARRRARSGDGEGALALYARALSAGREPELLLGRARVYRVDGRPREALADLDSALALRPQDPAALAARAAALAELGELERARADAALAVRLDPACACLAELPRALGGTAEGVAAAGPKAIP